MNIYDVNSNGDCVPSTDPNADLNALPGQEAFRAYFFQNWATKNGGRDWTRMDATLAAAAAHGEKIVAVLANEWNYCDGPTKFLPWWQSGYATTVNAGELTSYRQWVAEIVSRYANNPAIGIWQLVNEGEARNADGSCSEATAMTAMRSFADDVGGLIHTLDHNHLVSVGPISGECGTNEADYQTVYASPGADVCDYHDYGFPTSPGGNTDPWNGLGVSISRCHAIGRPIIVGEMAIHTTTTLTERAAEFSAKFSWQFVNGVAGSLMWDYSPTPQAPPSYEIGAAILPRPCCDSSRGRSGCGEPFIARARLAIPARVTSSQRVRCDALPPRLARSPRNRSLRLLPPEIASVRCGRRPRTEFAMSSSVRD